ncbi:hypothetical protein KR51_00008290 [Rubidibacter lacunae KORDI 51-2]|uniref:Glycosyltransferase RgtA/B/C/D-like domain-containing protein n=1 Tax=Rubidibacter lacunae KORDI 51-2 TaxID=582515 RepID=U5DLF9_9CHRO|nr:glycosyltransferase family 39 protein [Rubidibacter lacunae]ERN42511.1 hypothetical protein KR51_00008290 [Rubidibacter lacunae KORDI 51-2]
MNPNRIRKLILGTQFSYIDFIIPLLLAGSILLLAPIAADCEFNTDEGINLMKAVLYGQGFALYQDIWNDQPPVFTIALSFWMSLFGNTLVSARLMTWALSFLSIFSFYQLIRLQFGRMSAFFGALFLINSYQFVDLSVSVMIGLPAIALMLFVVYLLVSSHSAFTHKGQQTRRLAAGFVLALSLQTKLFVSFLMPIILILVLPLGRNFRIQVDRKSLSQLLQFFLLVLSTYIFISLTSQSLNSYDQLVATHVSAREVLGYQHKTLFFMLRKGWLNDYYLYILAGLGCFFAVRSWKLFTLVPIVWILGFLVTFYNHYPVRLHYYTLLAIPMSWLAAMAVYHSTVMISNYIANRFAASNNDRSTIVTSKSDRLYGYLFNVLASLTVLLTIYSISLEIHRSVVYQHSFCEQPIDAEIVSRLREYPKGVDRSWLLTDRPIYAFYAGLLLPPETAVFSQKRISVGSLDSKEIIRILEEYKPEQVLIGRFKELLLNDYYFQKYLQDNYLKTPIGEELEYYTRVDRRSDRGIRNERYL